ncbi:hypothetical protein HOU78_gp55 [Vibrio phage 1.204.O._10N.222.46.F12]|uniref:Uncharacterized protein n=1 Tax=Vibrio phage 1.204.O._10N.222.46.F12 TaxID=1881263 RepID=A0A2I7RNQ4_9CAUD|nr:hypothetical protein HOU78_gp55 [Vibrio phage 1.204.O._10N.222.46.F12]AUR95275.1 hypothetical protein NVP1204O_55 [Vibrio phage 1.204.O._10N.222.46.F12]
MTVQELKDYILENTSMTTTKAHEKALLIKMGKRKLEEYVPAASKQKVYIPRGYFYSLGMEETTVERKVTVITSRMATVYGIVKIAGKLIEVYQTDGKEWTTC